MSAPRELVRIFCDSGGDNWIWVCQYCGYKTREGGTTYGFAEQDFFEHMACGMADTTAEHYRWAGGGVRRSPQAIKARKKGGAR